MIRVQARDCRSSRLIGEGERSAGAPRPGDRQRHNARGMRGTDCGDVAVGVNGERRGRHLPEGHRGRGRKSASADDHRRTAHGRAGSRRRPADGRCCCRSELVCDRHRCGTVAERDGAIRGVRGSSATARTVVACGTTSAAEQTSATTAAVGRTSPALVVGSIISGRPGARATSGPWGGIRSGLTAGGGVRPALGGIGAGSPGVSTCSESSTPVESRALPPAPPPPAATSSRVEADPSVPAGDVRTSEAPPPPPPTPPEPAPKAGAGPPPLNALVPAPTVRGVPFSPEPPTSTKSVDPEVASTAALAAAPLPPAADTNAEASNPDPPAAPTALTWRTLTPSGTEKACSAPVYA